MMLTSTQNVAAPEESGDLIDLRSLGLMARRRVKPFLITAAIIFVLAMIALFLWPSYYSSTATVLIDRRVEAVTDVQAVLPGLPADSASVDTEAQVLQSPALVRQVVVQLGLTRDPEFNPALAPTTPLTLLSKAYNSLFPNPSGGGKSLVDKVTTNVLQNETVQRQGLTYVIGVTFSSLDAKKARTIANAIVAQYLQNQIAQKQAAANKATAYLNDRLSGLRQQVQASDAAAEALRAKAGLPDSQNQATFDQQAIQDLSRQAITLQSDLADKRASLAAAVAARSNPGALPAVLESNVIRDLKQQRAQAITAAADINNRYGALHPEVAKSRRQIADLDAEISAEISRIIAGLRNDVASAEGRLATIQGALAAQRGSAVSSAHSAVAVNQYEREATTSGEIYTDFLKRAKETGQSSDLARSDAALVAPGVVANKPSSPNRPLFAIVAVVFAAGCGVVAMILAELLDVKISSGSDVERHLGLTRLASVPALAKGQANENPAALIAERPLSSFAEAFRSIGTALSRIPSSGGAKVEMITSSLPHEGKTTIAIAFATILARAGRRVLLIDADLRRPQVSEAMRIARPAAGLGEVLQGRAAFDKAIVNQNGLDILLISSAPQDPEVLRGDQFARLIADLRGRYDHIVIDTPPVLAVNEGLAAARAVDAVLFVTRWRRTSRFAAKAAVEALRETGAPIAGVVLNAVNLKKQSLYSRDDSLAFYGAYRAYYVE